MTMNLLAKCVGSSFLAITLAVTLVGCDKQRARSIDRIVDLPSNPDGVATVPNPNHSGPHQIDLVVDLSVSAPNEFFCVDPTKPPNVFVVRGANGKKYLVIESNKECPGDPDHSGPHQQPSAAE